VIDEAMRAPNLRHVQSVLVTARGELVVERYFRDRRASDLSNVHSVTKSFVSTLVGMAVGDGSLALTTTLGDVFPEQTRSEDVRKAAITVQHLLTMTSGLAAQGPFDIDEIADAGDSWVWGPIRAPLQSAPGTAFVYNNGAAHVLGVMLATALGVPLERFAEDRLFGPLGIEKYRWPRDPEGNVLGWGHLEVRPRDLVRLGELYLRRGRTQGRQILNPDYIDRATSAATQGGGLRRELGTAISGGSASERDGRCTSPRVSEAST
jgi:CubicO group peptidase (beta-lactamase class C family)